MEGMRSGGRASEGIHALDGNQSASRPRAERRELGVLAEQASELRS